MSHFRTWVSCFISFFLVTIGRMEATAQGNIIYTHQYDSLISARQSSTLILLSREDTISTSSFWPKIKPALFFENLRKNITFPSKINQGQSTNFCGYAAMTHLMLKYHPDIYLKHVLELYHTG